MTYIYVDLDTLTVIGTNVARVKVSNLESHADFIDELSQVSEGELLEWIKQYREKG